MRASEGAIEGVKISAGEGVTLDVIGDIEPVGICGSGLVDAVAELVHCGLLDHSGRFIPDADAAVSHPALVDRLTMIGKERVFVLDWRGGTDPERRYSCPSATCASSSSPRPRSPPGGAS